MSVQVIGASRVAEVVDAERGRNRARVVAHHGDIFIETFGNHDGVSVHTTVRMTSARFRELVCELGVMG